MRRILIDSRVVPPSIPQKVSTSHLGTAFELLTLDLLTSHPYYMDLVRVGGANDKGVDLRGRWNPSSLGTRPLRSLDVIIQCKAERTPLRPAIIREFEGVLQNQFHQRNTTSTLGILVSLNGFSKQTINRSVEGKWPLSLVHLQVDRDKLRLDENGKLWKREREADETEQERDREVVSWSRNQAWKDIVAGATG
ncbi:hypothetical protein JCM16303_004216 [Sporobolomyces ruberrimus]